MSKSDVVVNVHANNGRDSMGVMEIFIGIDVGVSGALAAINKDGDILALCDMPTELKKNKKKRVDGRELNSWVNSVVDFCAPCKVVAVVEAVASMPRF